MGIPGIAAMTILTVLQYQSSEHAFPPQIFFPSCLASFSTTYMLTALRDRKKKLSLKVFSGIRESSTFNYFLSIKVTSRQIWMNKYFRVRVVKFFPNMPGLGIACGGSNESPYPNPRF